MASIAECKILSALDALEIIPMIVEGPHQRGPYGAKGSGKTRSVSYCSSRCQCYLCSGRRTNQRPSYYSRKDSGGAKEKEKMKKEDAKAPDWYDGFSQSPLCGE